MRAARVQVLRTYPAMRTSNTISRRTANAASPGATTRSSAGAAADLRRGPVPVVEAGRAAVRAGPAGQPGPAPCRRDSALSRCGRAARAAAQPDRPWQALEVCRSASPDRVHVFDIENHQGTPVYVHAKVCVIDDVWASVGSDNFNRRSWTHDSELSCAVLDPRAFSRATCGCGCCASTWTGRRTAAMTPAWPTRSPR